MREIEFRGKTGTTEGSEWVYGYYYKVKSFFDNESADYITAIRSHHLTDFSVNEETIGQYTGLKDKNGKKIFEGDIVKDDYCIYEVVYDGNGYYIEVVKLLKECGTQKGILYDLSDYKDLEVIGNIYDNPELLKEEL